MECGENQGGEYICMWWVREMRSGVWRGQKWSEVGAEGMGGRRGLQKGGHCVGTDVLLCLVHVAWVHNDM